MKTLRKCRDCGLTATTNEELDLFRADKRAKFGRENFCKSCDAKLNKKTRDSMSDESKKERKQYEKDWLAQRDKVSPDYYKRIGRSKKLEKLYGIDEEEYDKMFVSQDGCCAICSIHQSKTKNRFVVDHCHQSSKVRGLLCKQCNIGLGMFKDNVETMSKAIAYLQ